MSLSLTDTRLLTESGHLPDAEEEKKVMEKALGG